MFYMKKIIEKILFGVLAIILLYGANSYAMERKQELLQALNTAGYKNWGEFLCQANISPMSHALREAQANDAGANICKYLSCNCWETEDGPTRSSRAVQCCGAIGCAAVSTWLIQSSSSSISNNEILAVFSILSPLTRLCAHVPEIFYREALVERDKCRVKVVQELLAKKKKEV